MRSACIRGLTSGGRPPLEVTTLVATTMSRPHGPSSIDDDEVTHRRLRGTRSSARIVRNFTRVKISPCIPRSRLSEEDGRSDVATDEDSHHCLDRQRDDEKQTPRSHVERTLGRIVPPAPPHPCLPRLTGWGGAAGQNLLGTGPSPSPQD